MRGARKIVISFMKTYISLFVCFICASVWADELKDIPYSENADADAYAQEMCRLDVYNAGDKPKPVFVWFHGGGITGGDKKYFPDKLDAAKNGFVLVSANYRLSPKIKAWQAIEDCAEAVAWIFKNIDKIGGDKSRVFIGGHSAGAYLSGMVGFAPKYLQKHGIKNTDLAGIILLSGQTTKHFRVRKDGNDERPSLQPVIDELSILGNAQNKIPPLCIVVGDRRLEWKCRVEENFLLEATVRELKSSPYTEIFELQGLNHGTVASALAPIATAFIKKCSTLNKENKKADK